MQSPIVLRINSRQWDPVGKLGGFCWSRHCSPYGLFLFLFTSRVRVGQTLILPINIVLYFFCFKKSPRSHEVLLLCLLVLLALVRSGIHQFHGDSVPSLTAPSHPFTWKHTGWLRATDSQGKKVVSVSYGIQLQGTKTGKAVA